MGLGSPPAAEAPLRGPGVPPSRPGPARPPQRPPSAPRRRLPGPGPPCRAQAPPCRPSKAGAGMGGSEGEAELCPVQADPQERGIKCSLPSGCNRLYSIGCTQPSSIRGRFRCDARTAPLPSVEPPNTAKGCLASAPSPGRGTRSSPALTRQHPQCPLLSSGCRRWRPVGLVVHHSYTFVCPKAVTVRTIKTLLQRVLLPQAWLCGRSPRGSIWVPSPTLQSCSTGPERASPCAPGLAPASIHPVRNSPPKKVGSSPYIW